MQFSAQNDKNEPSSPESPTGSPIAAEAIGASNSNTFPGLDYSPFFNRLSRNIVEPFGGWFQAFGFGLPNNPFKRNKQQTLTQSQRSSPVRTPVAPKGKREALLRDVGFSDETLHNEHIELASFSRIEIGGKGEGHTFLPVDVMANPTWCDLCGDCIWSIYKQPECVKCSSCHYTLHTECRNLVTLDCKGDISPSEASTTEEVIISSDEESEKEEPEQVSEKIQYETLKKLDLKAQIDKYNVAMKIHGLEVSLDDSREFFHGFLRVHMNLTRPINVVAGTKPPSMYDVIYDEEENQPSDRTLTSFYLPRNTVKTIHIDSTTTTRDVIASLLKKFKVVDNPHKFCLYERSYETGFSTKARLRRVQDHERPLWLALMWTAAGEQKCLVLQENDCGDISWDAFSVPELNNFLRMLDREEKEYRRQVQQKYKLLESKLVHVINYHDSCR